MPCATDARGSRTFTTIADSAGKARFFKEKQPKIALHRQDAW
jgi:hypothetical protein